MKKLVVLLIVLSFILSLCACSTKHYDENNISELYDKEWIVGKSREEIEEKYGKIDRESVLDSGENVGTYYVNYDDDWFLGLSPSYIHDTYFVVFNDQGIALDAYFSKTSIGG